MQVKCLIISLLPAFFRVYFDSVIFDAESLFYPTFRLYRLRVTFVIG